MADVSVDQLPPARDLTALTDPNLIQILKYWETKRAGRPMPGRADIEASELRGLVSRVMLYDVVEPGRLYLIRLVGESIVNFVGVNNTGKSATDGMPPDAARQMLDILNSLVANRSPRFRAGHSHWHRDKSYRKFEACFLPLSSDGQNVDKILAGITFDVLDAAVPR